MTTKFMISTIQTKVQKNTVTENQKNKKLIYEKYSNLPPDHDFPFCCLQY